MGIENEGNNVQGGNNNVDSNIEEGGMVDVAINELGGVITKAEPIDEPIEKDDGQITETMADGKKVIITEDGSRYDAETGELILKGSND